MKKLLNIVFACLVCASLVISSVGCTGGEKTQTKTQTEVSAFPMTITDQIGRQVTIEKKCERIATCYYISSSACIAMGLSDRLVATEEKVEQRPIYKLAVPDLIGKLANTGSAKSFDLESCVASNPDVVILPQKAKSYISALEELGIKVIVVVPESHEQICEMFTIIGKITGEDAAAAKLVKEYNRILEKAEGLTSTIKDVDKPVVYMCNNSTYLSTAPKDMYQASLIRSAGGINAADNLEGDSWVNVSYEQLIAMNPDIMIIPTNNMANGYPSYTAEEILNDPQLSEITAVKNKAVYNMPAGYEAWDSPVPSGVLGLLWLTATISPNVYSLNEFADEAYNFYKTFYGFEFDKASVLGK